MSEMQPLQEVVDEVIAGCGDATGHMLIPVKLFRKMIEWAYSDGRLSALKEQRESLQKEMDILRGIK